MSKAKNGSLVPTIGHVRKFASCTESSVRLSVGMFVHGCQCLSEETLKAVGTFYLVSMPGEVKDPTSPHWNV